MKVYGEVCLFLLIVCFAHSTANARDTARTPRVDFATYLSGNSETTIVASALDPKGYLYVIGTTKAADFPTTAGAFSRTPKQVCNNGSCSYSTTFVTKLSRDGSSLIYSTFLDERAPLDITVDAAGNAYVIGGLVDPSYTGTPGAWKTKCLNPNTAAPNQFCGWLSKLNGSGSSLIYSTLIENTRVCFSSYDQRIAVNAAGEAYIAGSAGAFTSPATGDCYISPTAYRKTVTGQATGTLVMKFSADAHSVLFSTWVSGPTPRDEFRAIAIAPNDHAVIVGTAFSSNFPTAQNAFQRTPKGSTDGYVAKLSSDGSTLLASTLLAGVSIDEPTSVAVDSNLNVYVAGTTWSTDFPTTAGAYRRTLDTQDCGGQPGVHEQCPDIFVAKLPPDFSRLIYSTYLGGKGEDFSPFLAIDSVGHVYLTGVPAMGHPLLQPIQTEWRPLYVTKLNTLGSGLLFSTYFGGTLPVGGGFQSPAGIEVDAAGNAYIAWSTSSTNFPTTANAYQTFDHSNGQAGFLAKFDIPPCTLSSASPSVTICAPAAGLVTGSPVLIAAGATDNRAITGMVVYVDSVKKFTISNASHFDTQISMGVGTHHLTVKAWDAGGRVFSSGRDVVVR